MSSGYTNLPQLQQSKVSPFPLSDKEILVDLIAIHDLEAKIQDVVHLYNKVSNIVKEIVSKHAIDKLLELKYRGESKVSRDNNFVPTFHTLKDISSQMTNKSFDAYIAHETIMLILKKLHEYNWAAKGVTVLAAFALNYGEPWHVSKMVPTKANSLKIHISSSEDLERPTDAIIDYNTLVDPAMQLIKVVINVEKLIVKNDELKGTAEYELYEVPRDVYIYWAIFALLACAGHMALDLKSEIAERIATIINGSASQWKPHIAKVEDYLWRLNVFRSPSGVSQLLMALIFPRDIPYPEIYDNTTKSLVSPHELNTKHFLLFISDVWSFKGRVKDFINDVLRPMHESFMMDPKKSNYRILWVPVDSIWDENTKERFNYWKSMMPWYIVEYDWQPIKGLRVFNETWLKGRRPDPIAANVRITGFRLLRAWLDYSSMVVVDPQGNVLHPDALNMIRRWDAATAFPFTSEREKQLLEQYGWFWNLLNEATPQYINEWILNRSYIFVYGGTNKDRVKKFKELVERIESDLLESDLLEETIKQVNMEEELEIMKNFWDKLIAQFQERILNRKDGDDNVLLEMEMLLALKNEKAWVLFSKGPLVLAIDYDTLIHESLEEFENWKANIPKQSFDKAFTDYYHMKRSHEPERRCYHFQLENLAFAPENVICPELDCKLKMKMEIKSIKYTCCHEKLNQHLKNISEKKDDEATLQS